MTGNAQTAKDADHTDRAEVARGRMRALVEQDAIENRLDQMRANKQALERVIPIIDKALTGGNPADLEQAEIAWDRLKEMVDPRDV